MKVGLLWYDADRKKSVVEKIEEGARCYADKFGSWPNACHTNPETVLTHPKLRVIPNRLVSPNYFWLGVEEE